MSTPNDNLEQEKTGWLRRIPSQIPVTWPSPAAVEQATQPQPPLGEGTFTSGEVYKALEQKDGSIRKLEQIDRMGQP